MLRNETEEGSVETEEDSMETEESSVETEEGSIVAEEATFSAVYITNYLLATDGLSERYPTGYTTRSKSEESDDKLKCS